MKIITGHTGLHTWLEFFGYRPLLRVMASSSHIPPISATITAAPEEDSGLPQWLDDLLKPGVSNAVFTTLKLSLVGLVLVLCMMLSILEDPVRA